MIPGDDEESLFGKRRGATIVDFAVALTLLLIPVVLIVAAISLRRLW